MTRPWIFFSILALGVAADLLTKAWAFEWVAPGGMKAVFGEWFHIAPTRNPGAMWSLFQDVPPWVWVVVRGSIAVALFTYYVRHGQGPLHAHLGFSLVLAGAVGNLSDNLFAPAGMVRDFVMVDLGFYVWPTFNVADSMICVGAGLLLVFFLGQERAVKREHVVAVRATKAPDA
jgi:signal peptidase II